MISSVSAGLVSGAFCFAGIGKLRNRTSQYPALSYLGIQGRHAVLANALLAYCELLVAGALLVERSSLIALTVSALMLASFVVLGVHLLRQGFTGPCGCFGAYSWHSTAGAQLLTSALLLCIAGAGALAKSSMQRGGWRLDGIAFLALLAMCASAIAARSVVVRLTSAMNQDLQERGFGEL